MITLSTMGHTEALRQGFPDRSIYPGFQSSGTAAKHNRTQFALIENRGADYLPILKPPSTPTESLLYSFRGSNYALVGGDASAGFIRTKITQAGQRKEAAFSVPLPGANFPIGDQQVPGSLIVAKNAPILETSEGIFKGSQTRPEVYSTAALLWVPVPIDEKTKFSENFTLLVGEKPLKVDNRVRGRMYKFHQEGSPLVTRPGDAFMFGTSTSDAVGGAAVFPLDMEQFRFIMLIKALREPNCEEELRVFLRKISQLGNIRPGTINLMKSISIASPALPRETVIHQ